MGLYDSCSVAPMRTGHCGWCDAPLPPRRRRWCSEAHMKLWEAHHIWGYARDHALKRDGHQCRRCGALLKRWSSSHVDRAQVNHIVPRNGQGYGPGCHHHQDNLETVCQACHSSITAEQAKARRNGIVQVQAIAATNSQEISRRRMTGSGAAVRGAVRRA